MDLFALVHNNAQTPTNDIFSSQLWTKSSNAHQCGTRLSARHMQSAYADDKWRGLMALIASPTEGNCFGKSVQLAVDIFVWTQIVHAFRFVEQMAQYSKLAAKIPFQIRDLQNGVD